MPVAARRRISPALELDLRRTLARFRTDPVKYARHVLKVDLTPQQLSLPDLLATPPYRVLVPSANKVGKTFALSWLIQHFHDTRIPSLVQVTSSTQRQIKTQLWKEIRRTRPLQLGLPPKATLIEGVNETHRVDGFAAANPDSFQGGHEADLLLVFDEATNVDGVFWDRAESMFSGIPTHGWIACYNPNDPTTEAYVQEQSGKWHVLRLSALDHPNIVAELRGERPPIPAAVRLKRVIDRMYAECEFCGEKPADETCFLWPPEQVREQVPHDAGEAVWGWWKPISPLFEVQVLGRWPSQAFNAVWSKAVWDACKTAIEWDPAWACQLGCDVARFGADKTAIAVRRGIALVHLERLSKKKSPEIAERLRELAHHFAPPGVNPKTIPILVDDTGGYGSGVTDYPGGYNVRGINASESAERPHQYPNRRSEMGFTLRLAADQGCFNTSMIPREQEDLARDLSLELMAARYAIDRKNRRVVESKDAIRVRLKRSPDLADAAALAWYQPAT